MIMSVSIQMHQLTKYYLRGTVAAVDKLTLQIAAGEVYGFLGANGAGKSTTIRMLMGFLQPSAGSASIMGLDSVRESVAIKSHVGYLAGDIALYGKPTGRQVLDYLSDLQPARPYRAVLEKRFEADLDKPISTLSKGNRQKIGIIQAFMHEPAVLILDEPTSGLDPLMQEAFYETLAESKARGAAVLMSSHNLVEAQRSCDRIGIIKHGKLIKEQVIGQDTTFDTIVFKVVFSKPADLTHAKDVAALKFLSAKDSHTALFEAKGSIAEALKALSRYDISELSTQQLDLEDEFMDFYGDAS